jgi:hypothetical protein
MLSHKEFDRLTREEKVAYLAAAIEAVTNNVPVVNFPVVPPSTEDKGDT